MNEKNEILVRLVRSINGNKPEVYNFPYTDSASDLERAKNKFKELVVDEVKNSIVFNSYTGNLYFYSDLITKNVAINTLSISK